MLPLPVPVILYIIYYNIIVFFMFLTFREPDLIVLQISCDDW